ncbi:helix-turn-helix domain-containing protein [Natronomonas sp.]|uniref:helix-turn-helix domain-containing protein n=1 Tax=Natronomonas sp. TaxID=2184060 RepID=UPI00263A3C21|nr:helix-turn-helix domain-containing protein [Natronomonas sp.]
MPQARLRVELPDGPWVADVSREHPGAVFEVLTALPEEGRGVGLVRIRSDSLESVLGEIRAHGSIEHVSVVQRTDSGATVQIETNRPMILLAAKRAGMPVEMPVEIRDGTATVDVSGARERLSEFGEQLSAMGIGFELEYVRERIDPEELLTDRQRELLDLAVSEGHYDTPRRCTLTDLADELGLAKSTCSETLHRAEEVLIKEFVHELLPGIDLGGDPAG